MIRKFLCSLLHCCDKPAPLPEVANASFNSDVAEYRIYIRDAGKYEAFPRLMIKRVADGEFAQVALTGADSIWPLLKIGIASRK